nr:MAG TPA: hypothetical protein [Caudoviricetes sp.]
MGIKNAPDPLKLTGSRSGALSATELPELYTLLIITQQEYPRILECQGRGGLFLIPLDSL